MAISASTMPKVLVALDGEIAMFERKLLKRLKPGKDLVNALIRHYKYIYVHTTFLNYNKRKIPSKT